MASETVISGSGRAAEESPRGRRRLLVAVLAIGCVLPSAVMAWRWRDMPNLGNLHDDSIYWLCGRSLAEGRGYHLESLPGQPWQTKYPPLMPLYLSTVWRIDPRFPENLPLATLACWILLPVWMALAWRVMRDLGEEAVSALALCLFLGVNLQVMQFTFSAGADMLFAILWMACLAVMGRTRSMGMALAAGALGGAAYLTKTAAAPLALVAAWTAWRGEWKRAAAFAAGMLPTVAGWSLWMRAHLVHSNDPLFVYYTDYFRYHLFMVDGKLLPALVSRNAMALVESMGRLLAGPAFPALTETAAGVIAARTAMLAIGSMALAGFILRVRDRGPKSYEVFVAGYMLLLLGWHYPPDERFLLPVMPVLLSACWWQMRSLWNAAGGRLVRKAPVLAGLAAALSVWIGLGIFQADRVLANIREVITLDRSVYAWIRQNTPADAKFLAYDDVLLYLYTGRTGFRPVVPTRYFYRQDEAGVTRFVGSLPELARQHGLDYILDSPRDWHGELLPPGLAQSSHRILEAAGLPVVLQLGTARIYSCRPKRQPSGGWPGAASITTRFQTTRPPYQ